jgi:CRISPR-associated endonuclease/helicase Cas3
MIENAAGSEIGPTCEDLGLRRQYSPELLERKDCEVAYFAHTVDGKLDKGQYLAEHLMNVAEGAEERAAAAMPDRVGVATAARAAGLLHDIGKYRDGFIGYLKNLKIPDVERYHKQAGAAWAERMELGPVVTAILGHHGGMPDYHEIDDSLDGIAGRQAADKVRERAIADCPALGKITPGPYDGLDEEELLTRLLFSCLVDADWEDTARHEQTAKGIPPDPIPPALDAEGWRTKVLAHIAEKAAGSTQPTIANARADVLKCCLEAAGARPGLFSLTVPTGGGKTLSGLAFALAHAKAHGLRRMIYVVPYLSILDQNAKVIREALGIPENDPAVLEHHSLADTGKPPATGKSRDEDGSEDTKLEDAARRAENWDAPVIITTNVMFFESLFSNQPRRCRKLHNIARSVIFLDECQNIPPELLEPTVAMLKQLVEVLGCSVVLATATQPALDHPDLKKNALSNVNEIIPKDIDLFSRLKRVRIEWPKLDVAIDWPTIASRMCDQVASLCVVNSRLGARELFNEVKALEPEGAYHLSTSMCPEHRMAVLDKVRRRLKKGRPCRLVSTQLIEAGVDVDFPLVFREMAPFDSIIQAAGRCNREAKLAAGGLVVVFRSAAAREKPGRYFPKDPWYKGGRDVVETAFLKVGHEPEVDDPAAIREYFQRVYRLGSLDKNHIGTERHNLNFKKVAGLYRLIDNAGLPVVVPTWIEHQSKVESMIESFQATRAGFRALGPFQVNLRCDPATPPAGVCEEKPGLFVWRGLYDSATGWSGEDDLSRWTV